MNQNFKRKSTFKPLVDCHEQWNQSDENCDFRNNWTTILTFWAKFTLKCIGITFLDQLSLWIDSNELKLMMSSDSHIFYMHIVYEILKNLVIFSIIQVKTVSPYQNVSWVKHYFLHLLWVVIRQVLYFHSIIIWDFCPFLYMKWIENCEGMTSSTRFIYTYYIRTGHRKLSKIYAKHHFW